jgi:hypothetical protein
MLNLPLKIFLILTHQVPCPVEHGYILLIGMKLNSFALRFISTLFIEFILFFLQILLLFSLYWEVSIYMLWGVMGLYYLKDCLS